MPSSDSVDWDQTAHSVRSDFRSTFTDKKYVFSVEHVWIGLYRF